MTKIECIATAFITAITVAFFTRLLSGIADGLTLFMLIVGIVSVSTLSLYQDNNRLDKMARGLKL